MSALFATDIIDCYILQWHPLIPLHIACICQELLTLVLLLQNEGLLVLKRILFIPAHAP